MMLMPHSQTLMFISSKHCRLPSLHSMGCWFVSRRCRHLVRSISSLSTLSSNAARHLPVQDTLLLMGLDEQYAEARQWVAHSMLLHQVPVPSGTAT